MTQLIGTITGDPVRKRVSEVASAYRTKAAKDKAIKAFMAPRSRRDSARRPKGTEPSNPEHRMYMKPGEYLDQHGEAGRNIIKKGYGKTNEDTETHDRNRRRSG